MPQSMCSKARKAQQRCPRLLLASVLANPWQSEQRLGTRFCSSISQAGRKQEAAERPHQLQLLALPLQALHSGLHHSNILAGA